ncbi:hypothetical protein D9M68_223530 [compost metagenome]
MLQKENNAENPEVQEQRLNALRSTDTAAYLAELRDKRHPNFDAELKALRPSEYASMMEKRVENETNYRAVEISNLKEELKNPTLTDERTVDVYRQLASLEPSKKEYSEKVAHLERVAAERRMAAELLTKQQRRPMDFVSIAKFQWSKEGFGTVMEATFTIKNDLPWSIKDVEVTCELAGPSGTKIDSNSRTIYERLGPRSAKVIRNFNMGFIHNQSASSNCRIDRVVVMR